MRPVTPHAEGRSTSQRESRRRRGGSAQLDEGRRPFACREFPASEREPDSETLPASGPAFDDALATASIETSPTEASSGAVITDDSRAVFRVDLRVVAALAVAFRVAVFAAAAFAAVFRAGVLAEVFFAAVFAVRLLEAFVAAVARDVAFFAVVFAAVAFLPAVFLAVVAFAAALPRVVFLAALARDAAFLGVVPFVAFFAAFFRAAVERDAVFLADVALTAVFPAAAFFAALDVAFFVVAAAFFVDVLRAAVAFFAAVDLRATVFVDALAFFAVDDRVARAGEAFAVLAFAPVAFFASVVLLRDDVEVALVAFIHPPQSLPRGVTDAIGALSEVSSILQPPHDATPCHQCAWRSRNRPMSGAASRTLRSA